MQQYVIVYANPIHKLAEDNVLVVRKDRPLWQKNRYNLPGGKIEDGEEPEAAAIRELEEETGLTPIGDVEVMGCLVGSWGIVHCVKIPTDFWKPVPRSGETEEFSWQLWESLRDDPKLIPNLKVVIPLMLLGVKDWVIADEGLSIEGTPHTICVTV